ncbi:MAG TPA: PEGA domain-containing protein [Candidatus Woesebacteria bacterium]|nr:PEGA domain-containing protein [Candidatus Woesebacteria bacterium]
MTKHPKAKRIIINILIVLFLAIGTTAGILYAKGYRPNIKEGSLQGSGLLNVTSYPQSARVMIDGKLTTVTDDKLYLYPSNYTIKIEKDGFHPWTKVVPVKSELVSNANARLFPIITATYPLTFYQAGNAAINADGSKMAYVLTDSPVDTANGIYVHSFSGSLLNSSQTTQITDNTTKDFTKALLIWSPDSSQILAVFTEKTKNTEKIVSAMLLSAKNMNNIKSISDVTLRLPSIINTWQDQYAKINKPILTLYPSYMVDILTEKAKNVYFSPDKEKVFYTATIDATLPENEIGKTLPNINSTPETRNLKKDVTYLFDTKEGTNYQLHFASGSATLQKTLITVAEATPSADITTLKQLKAQSESYLVGNLSWYSNSTQIIVTNADGVNIADYDGLNMTNITYVQPKEGFAVSSPDGNRLIILTNINQKVDTYNLISFDLK